MNSQTSLFDEARARRTDPDTSHEAAASVWNIRTSQVAVLGMLRKYGPATDEQLISDMKRCPLYMSPSGIRTRRAELVAKGLVEYAGYKQVISTGRQARVWKAV